MPESLFDGSWCQVPDATPHPFDHAIGNIGHELNEMKNQNIANNTDVGAPMEVGLVLAAGALAAIVLVEAALANPEWYAAIRKSMPGTLSDELRTDGLRLAAVLPLTFADKVSLGIGTE